MFRAYTFEIKRHTRPAPPLQVAVKANSIAGALSALSRELRAIADNAPSADARLVATLAESFEIVDVMGASYFDISKARANTHNDQTFTDRTYGLLPSA